MNATIAATLDDGEGSPRHWLLVVTLMAIFMFAFIDRVILSLLIDPIRQDLGATDFEIALLIGIAFAFFYAAFSVPAGYYVDRINRRALIGAASVLWGVMTIVCGTADTMTQLFIGRVGVGVAESVIAPCSFSLIRDAVPARSRGLAFSLFGMAPLIGAGISLIGGGYLLRAAIDGAFAGWPLLGALEPWQCALTVVGLIGMPFSLLLLLTVEPERSKDDGTVAKSSGLIRGYGVALSYVRGNLPVFIPFFAFAACGTMSSFATSAWLPAAIGRRWALAPQDVGPVLGLMTTGCGVAGLLVGGTILNLMLRRGADIRIYGAIAATGVAIGLGGSGIAPSLNAALALAGLGLFFVGASFSVGATTLSQITPVMLIGRVTSFYLLFQTLLGQALGPLIVATVSDNFFTGPDAVAHAMTVVMPVFGVLTVVAALVLGRRLASGRLNDGKPA